MSNEAELSQQEPASHITEADSASAKTKKTQTIRDASLGVRVWPPLHQDYRRRTRLLNVVTTLLVCLALLLVVSGFGFIILATNTQYHTSLQAQATAKVQATANAVSTVQAQQQGTADAVGTVQANIDATATTQADVIASATATIDNATATATALSDIYTRSTTGTPALDDPLSDNTGTGKWDQGSSLNNSACLFNNGAYHVTEVQKGFFQPCIAQATRFSSFAYQVHMTIDKGNLGQVGLIFRIDNTNTSYYFFHIGMDGSYAFDAYKSNNQVTTLTTGFSNAINLGLGQSNQLIVIATGDTYNLYANGQPLVSLQDSTFSVGKIGVAVIDQGTPIDVEFSDAQVWRL